ncbi:MAG: pyridoxamine 5'-phosphate oxidase family protein [Syntrophobacteraceae bacterium]
MSIAEYFENTKGQGILATADNDGNVDAAVYAKPKILDENTIAFIMRDRLTHANVKLNSHACYVFVEREGGGYRGLRLYLTKLYEEEDSERLYALRRPDHNAIAETGEERGPLFLVAFKIDKIRAITPRGGNPLEEERAVA